jgi:hypothetical protein
MGRPLKDLSPETFSLSPPLASRLRGLSESLYDGVGFVLIRGLDPNAYSMKENITIHAGLTSYFGSKRGYTGGKGNDVLGTPIAAPEGLTELTMASTHSRFKDPFPGSGYCHAFIH